MSKYTIKECEGYWQDDPLHVLTVHVALEEWDGQEDGVDEGIFYYMDNDPLNVGAVISEGFLITDIYED